jgi:NDP-sugar pyrophosphorylase family protein
MCVIHVRTAVVIAGGEGSRLMPLTADRPKTMVEVGGKPLLYWIVNWLKSYGIKHLVIGVAYKKEKVLEYMAQNKNFGLEVDFSEHTLEGGTAQGFKLAIDRFVKDENFVAMNADELTNMNLNNLIKMHEDCKPLVTMALSPFYCRFSVVDVDGNHKITSFQYGKKIPSVNVSNGIYIFNSGIRKYIPDSGSIEDKVFAKLTQEGKLAAYVMEDGEEWISVNTMKDMREAEEKLRSWKLI